MASNFDRLIDDAARAMTARDPPAHLRTRVLARLDSVPARRQAWPWIAGALAATAAAAVLTTIILRQPRSVITPQVIAASHPTPVTPAPQVTSSASNQEAARISQRATTARQTPVMSADELAWHARAIPALAPIDAMNLDDIQPAPLAIPQLSIDAIGTTTVTIAPIERASGAR